MDITRYEGIDIVAMADRIDSDSAGVLEKALNNLLAEGSKIILCDFSGTSYISSAGLRVLLSVTKTLLRSKGRMALCSLRPNVNEVFTISGFNQIIPIYYTREDAIKMLSGKSSP
jgi:anti-anti-sigma factor